MAAVDTRMLEPVADVNKVKTEPDPFMTEFLSELLESETFDSVFDASQWADNGHPDGSLLGMSSSSSSDSDAGYSGYSSDSHPSDISTDCDTSTPASPIASTPMPMSMQMPVPMPMQVSKQMKMPIPVVTHTSSSSSFAFNKSNSTRPVMKNTKKRGVNMMSSSPAVSPLQTRAPPPVMKVGMTKEELSKLRREARKIRNRESANRSRMKRLQYTGELELLLSEKNAVIAQLQAQLQAALDTNKRHCSSSLPRRAVVGSSSIGTISRTAPLHFNCSASSSSPASSSASSSSSLSSSTSTSSTLHRRVTTDTSSLGIVGDGCVSSAAMCVDVGVGKGSGGAVAAGGVIGVGGGGGQGNKSVAGELVLVKKEMFQ